MPVESPKRVNINKRTAYEDINKIGEEGPLSEFRPAYSKVIRAFGVEIVTRPDIDDKLLVHVSNIMAQYIDNNMDGIPDNTVNLVEVKAKAHIVLLRDEEEWDLFRKHEFEGIRRAGRINPDDIGVMFANHMNVNRPEGLQHETFDETLKHCWFLLSRGYARLWPEIFGAKKGTALGNAMDKAMTGPKAWFTPKTRFTGAGYTGREVCDYACQTH